MTTQEHLNKILEKCRAFLEIAEKRTPGEWKASLNYLVGGWWVQTPFNEVAETSTADFCNENDAAFIATCAGPAEAMARSTIAAINNLQLIHEQTDLGEYAAWDALQEIIAAWPEEIL